MAVYLIYKKRDLLSFGAHSPNPLSPLEPPSQPASQPAILKKKKKKREKKNIFNVNKFEFKAKIIHFFKTIVNFVVLRKWYSQIAF